ncbi:hypothetical protein INR49_005110 [Caranx melampygus]|nr:hypothetical protein INR49_005110 [Caranx melampygus]
MATAEGTMLQIEALSESINNLTYLLSREELQKELRRSQTALGRGEKRRTDSGRRTAETSRPILCIRETTL